MYISEFYCICVFNNVYPRIYTVKYVFVYGEVLLIEMKA